LRLPFLVLGRPIGLKDFRIHNQSIAMLLNLLAVDF
jgi:hypothetical protein